LVDGFVQLRLLGSGTLAQRIVAAKHAPVENQVDVFRKALDQAIDLGQAGAALEHQQPRQLRRGEQAVEHPRHPEVLLHHGRRHAEPGRRFGK
jgi:hypothetical protein